MKIETFAALRAPRFRLRLTFGAVRPATRGQTPMVIALPFTKPEQSCRQVVRLDIGERVNHEAIKVVLDAVEAGASAVVACASLLDAAAAFADLAEVAGYDTRGAA